MIWKCSCIINWLQNIWLHVLLQRQTRQNLWSRSVHGLNVVWILVTRLHVGQVRPKGGSLHGVDGLVREVVGIHLQCHLVCLGQAVDLGKLCADKRPFRWSAWWSIVWEASNLISKWMLKLLRQDRKEQCWDYYGINHMYFPILNVTLLVIWVNTLELNNSQFWMSDAAVTFKSIHTFTST